MNLSAIRRRELANSMRGYGDAIIGILDKNVLTKVDSIDYKCHYKDGFCSGFKSRCGMTFLQYRNAVKGNFYVDGALNKKKLEDFIVKDLDLSKITCLIMILRVKKTY